MLNLQKKLYVATFQTNAHEVANQYGLGLEFNNTCISEDLDAGNRRKLISVMNQDLNENGFESAILHGPFTELYPAGIDRRARLMAKERLNEAFDVCRALSVSKMVVHTGWLPFIYFKEWQAEKSAAFWQDFMQDKPEAFTIYIENVLEDEPYMLADMMRRISNPQIKLCLDVGHANAMTQKHFRGKVDTGAVALHRPLPSA